MMDKKYEYDWAELHEELVAKIIEFCKKRDITANEVYFHADGLKESIEDGCWTPCTDSTFELYNYDYNIARADQDPILFSA